MAADDGDDIAKTLLRSVIETLGLCAPCKSRLLDKDATSPQPLDSESDDYLPDTESDTAPPADTSSDHEFDIEYTQSTTRRARFTKSTLQTLTNVIFKNATLRNAHFHNIDFTKVTFKDIELEDVEWTDQFLEHAVLNKDSYKIRLCQKSKPELVFPVLSWRSTSRTRGGYNAGDDATVTVGGQLHARAELKKITLTLAPKTGLLSLPDGLLRNIAGHLLFPRKGAVKITDWPEGAKGTQPEGRTTYSSHGRNITYVSWPAEETSTSHEYSGNIADAPKLNLHISFLQTCRRLYGIGVPLLDERLLWFPGSHSSALAFLHDHKKSEHKIQKIRLWAFNGGNGVFRRLLDVILYERPEVDWLCVATPKAFWDTMPWDVNRDVAASGNAQWAKCVEDVLNWIDPTMGVDTAGNLFTQLARLPLRHGGHSLRVNVLINNTGMSTEMSADTTSFLKAMTETLTALRSEQAPDLAKHRPGDHCQEKELVKCCYWRPHEGEVLLKPRSFLKLPEHVIGRIVQYLFPVAKHSVIEAPTTSWVSASMNETQTKYWRKDSEAYRTTYTSWSLDVDQQDSKEKTSLPGRLGMCTAFLRVNRQCYKLGTEALYSRGIRFDSSPGTCLAFLHDHQRKEHRITSVSIRYDDKSKCYAWRRLFNALVHSRADLTSLTVKIGSRFWEVAPWNPKRTLLPSLSLEQKAKRVLAWTGWCISSGGTCCGERNFLAHVARLPLKAGGQDVLVKVNIDGVGDDQARKDFLEALNIEIAKRRIDRPCITEVSHKVCRRKVLEQCCYWNKDTMCSRLDPMMQLMPLDPKK